MKRVWFFILVTALPAAAEDPAGSRDVRLVSPGGRQLQINQIDTSRFPRVDIFATVMENSQPVQGLQATDFKVREDEVPQEPVNVEPRLLPLSAVVTIDTSGSMIKAIDKTREAAASFVDTLASNDSVAVVSFNRTVQVVAPVGSTRDSAKNVIRSLQARGDTALFDALYESLSALRGKSGRRAVILLSDGVDDDGQGRVLSKRTVREVLALAQELNVPVFTIGLGTQLDEATLKQVAVETGGEYYMAPTPEELQTLYGKLGRQLSGQYHIFYSSNLPADGSVHTVQLWQGDLRSAKGYSSPAGAAASAPVKAQAAVVEPPQVKQNLEVTGSLGPEDAPVLPLNTKVLVKSASVIEGRAEKMFVSFDAASGARIAVEGSAKRAGDRFADCSHLLILSPDLQQAAFGNNCTKDGSVSAFAYVANENEGKWYLAFENIESIRVGVYVQIVEDGGSGRDAGSSESTAVPLNEGNPVMGVIEHKFDPADAFNIALRGGVPYQARVRPSVKEQLELTVHDENGTQVATGKSENKGAGVTLNFTPASAMNALVSVKGCCEYMGYASYSLVVGPEGVAAPKQPSPVTETLRRTP